MSETPRSDIEVQQYETTEVVPENDLVVAEQILARLIASRLRKRLLSAKPPKKASKKAHAKALR